MSVLKNCHPYHLFKLYNQCHKIPSPLIQSLAKQKMSNLSFKIFKVRPTGIMLFSIKQNEILLYSFLKTLPIPQDLLLLLQSQTKVTFKSHPQISSLFCNNITWCKKWSEKPFPCHCTTLKPFLGVNQSCEHISTLGHETKSPYDNVLHSNLNNVCSPNILSFPEEFHRAFMTYYYNILHFCEIFKESVTFFPLSPSSKYCTNKAFNNLFDTLNSFSSQPPCIWKIIHELDSFPQSFKAPAHIPTSFQVQQVSRLLLQKLVRSTPDKNIGVPDVYCPSILWKQMYTSFWKNVHFQKCPHLSAQSLLLYFKHVFDVNNWSKFGSFNSQGEAPYPYIKRKFKDLSRLQGIISYFHHPLKDIYFKVAAGLMTYLKAFNFFHTNLFNPFQALPTMKLLFLQLHNKFDSETTFHSWAADVKEMYDWLPQADILKAVHWILSYISRI